MIKKFIFMGVPLFLGFTQLSIAQTESTWSPSIKMKALVHSRFETSLTDSLDVQNRFSGTPVDMNFRIRRLEVRSDIKLNDKWSGVVRLQLPALKTNSSTSTLTAGNVIELAYGEYKAKDALQFRFGQFKIPYELDELTSHEDLRMVDRGTTSSLLVSNNQASYQPGLMIFGNLLKDKTPLNYYLAIVNGNSRALNYDDNTQKNLVERLEFSPVKGFRIGANAQQIFLNDSINTMSYGADLQFIKNISEKTKLILEGEYIVGSNLSTYVKDLA
ncbi:MAG: porin, partial [Chitinophagales bacterium]